MFRIIAFSFIYFIALFSSSLVKSDLAAKTFAISREVNVKKKQSSVSAKQNQKKNIQKKALLKKKRVVRKKSNVKGKGNKTASILSMIFKKNSKSKSIIKKKPFKKGTINYYSFLNSINKKNARITGMDLFFKRKNLGRGQSIAVIEYSGTWDPILNIKSGKVGSLHPNVIEKFKSNVLVPIGKGPNLDPNKVEIEIAEKYNRDHGSDVTSYFLDYSPEAKVLPVSTNTAERTTQEAYDVSDALFNLAKRKDIKIINWSSGYFETTFNQKFVNGAFVDFYKLEYTQRLIRAIKAVTKAGKVLVMAAGNEGENVPRTSVYQDYRDPDNQPEFSNTNLIADLVRDLDPETRKSFVIAGNLDPDTRKAHETSNRPGKNVRAQQQFIYAPAAKIQVTYSGKVYNGGTSSAAPYICAALANMLSKSNKLTPKKALEILLETAEKRADIGTYGRGVIRISKAIDRLDRELPSKKR